MRGKFTVDKSGQTLGALLRQQVEGLSWEKARRLIERSKVDVDGTLETDPAVRIPSGKTITYDAARPTITPPPPGRIVFEDSQVVVLDKPSGISSVPYTKKETGTAMDLIREHWRRQKRQATVQPLYVVHRIDKETSGLLAFAKTKTAERALADQFRAHEVGRKYICVAHGGVLSQRIESRLVQDRGDGLRGTLRGGKAKGGTTGKLAITHVKFLETLEGATLLEVQLETGKTHQIRIHLSETGHPLVGERVYIRDFERAGHTLIECPRLLLHAQTLAFRHPSTQALVELHSDLPSDFTTPLAALSPRKDREQ